MKRYRRVKTTQGHRYTMRMPEEEVAERILYRVVLTVVPFCMAALFTFLFFKG